MSDYTVVNSRAPRIDAPAKATGSAVFIDDIGALGIMSETYAGSEMTWHGRGVRYARLPEIRERDDLELLDGPHPFAFTAQGDLADAAR